LADADARLADVVGPDTVGPDSAARTFLKCGRAVVEVRRPT
jgi:hypothetical protein